MDAYAGLYGIQKTCQCETRDETTRTGRSLGSENSDTSWRWEAAAKQTACKGTSGRCVGIDRDGCVHVCAEEGGGGGGGGGTYRLGSDVAEDKH